MLLDLAEAMTPLLQAREERIRNGKAILREGYDEEDMAETTLQILFFDGEEAFHDWSDTDSIYGARQVFLCLDFPYLLNRELTNQASGRTVGRHLPSPNSPSRRTTPTPQPHRSQHHRHFGPS